jgi:hypothetical protein
MRFAMFHPTKVLAWRIRSVVMAVVTLAAWHVQAAVLPLTGDATGGGVGPRASLLDEPMSHVSGQWVGHTSSGRLISLVLRINEGAVVGGATLDGVAADVTNGPRPLVTPTVTGRTMAFGVLATPCAKSLARGVVTFVSDESAQLDLHAGSTPISVRLSKVS